MVFEVVSRILESLRSPENQIPSISSQDFDDVAPDSELLAIFVATRSPEAAERLVRRHSSLVARLVRRMLQNTNDAEDAFQATFLVMLKSASKIRNQGSLASWLYGVAYRTAFRIRRQSKARHMESIDEPINTAIAPEIDPLEKIATAFQLELLDRELQSLQPSLRDVLIEHYLLGQSVPEIADRFELSNSAVEGRLRRGRAALRQKLARRGISFSVAVAIAVAYQSRSVAAYAEPWQQTLFQSQVFSQTVSSGSPPAEHPLQQFIQGEPAMSSILTTKWVASAAATLTLLGGLLVLQLGSSGDGQSINPFVLSAAATEEGNRSNPVEIAQSSEITPPSARNPTSSSFGSNNTPRNTTTRMPNRSAVNVANGALTLAVSGSQNSGLPTQKTVTFTPPSGPVPNWMTSGGTIAEEEEQAREILRRNLRKLVKFDFTNVPLRNVIDTFKSDAEIPIIFDEAAMAAGGAVTLEDPVNLTGLPEMSLQRALTTLLDPLQLTYVVKPDYILITTNDAKQNRVLRTYDLAYLLPSNEKSEEVVRLIQSVVSSNWDINGGEDTLHMFGSMLLASCPEESHLGIEGLLFQLSRMSKDNLSVSSLPINAQLPNGVRK